MEIDYKKDIRQEYVLKDETTKKLKFCLVMSETRKINSFQ